MVDDIVIREMDIQDYEKIMDLWWHAEGVRLSDADSKENIGKFLKRNAGISFIAERDGEIIGTILCGYDGRRGYLHHLTVKAAYRGNGLGRRLVESCLTELQKQGIKKCHLFVLADNQQGMNFWNHIGFQRRDDVNIFSKDI